MDRLPTELVLMILKKIDPLTIYKLKYQNKRLSRIICKYYSHVEVQEIRVTTGFCSAILHDEREVLLFPEDQILDNFKDLTRKIRTQTVFVDRVILNDVNMGKGFKFNNMDYFYNENSVEYLDDFFSSSFLSLKSVNSLEINSSHFRNDPFLIWYLKKYRVRLFALNDAKFTHIYDGFWIKMMNVATKIKRFSLSCSALNLNLNFVTFVCKHDIPYVRINAGRIDFQFDGLIALIQNAIDKQLPMDLSIFSCRDSNNFVNNIQLTAFLWKNNIGSSRLQELVECEQETLVITLPNGRVQFPKSHQPRFSFMNWLGEICENLRKILMTRLLEKIGMALLVIALVYFGFITKSEQK